jgi:O-antigen ligase
MSIPTVLDRDDRPAVQRSALARRPDRLSRRAATIAFSIVAAALTLLPALANWANAQAFCGALAFTALFGFVLHRDAPRIARRDFPVTELGIGILLLGGAAAISVFAGKIPAVSILAAMPFVALVASFFATRILIHSRADVRRIVFGFAISIGILGTFGLLGFLRFQDAIAAGAATETERAAWLSTPLYPHSYIAAQVIAPVVPFLLAHLLGRPTRTIAILTTLALAVAVPFLVLTFSRAIWLALSLSTLIVFVTSFRRIADLFDRAQWFRTPRQRAILAASIAAIVAIVAFSPLYDRLIPIVTAARARLTSLLDPTVADFNFSRLQVWSNSLGVAVDHQPFGVGIGRFAAELAQRDEGRRFIPHAHNQFVQLFTETGVLGLAGLCWLLFGAIALARRALWNCKMNGADATPIRGALGALVVFAVICWFETPLLHTPCAAFLGIVTGIIANSTARTGVVPITPAVLPSRVLPRCIRAALAVSAISAIAIALAFALHVVAVVRGRAADEALRLGDPESAVRLAASGARLQPQIEWLTYLEAEARVATNDLEGACDAYRRYSELVPRVPHVSLKHAQTLSRLNHHEEAVELLQDARHRAPAEMLIDVDYHLANSLTWIGRDEEARIIYLGLAYRHADVKYPELPARLMGCLERLGREHERGAMAAMVNAKAAVAETPAPAGRP